MTSSRVYIYIGKLSSHTGFSDCICVSVVYFICPSKDISTNKFGRVCHTYFQKISAAFMTAEWWVLWPTLRGLRVSHLKNDISLEFVDELDLFSYLSWARRNGRACRGVSADLGWRIYNTYDVLRLRAYYHVLRFTMLPQSVQVIRDPWLL